ncbi:MAG: transketolase family protein [Firmicutes bacterium]|nr:transketolase family protein [Bacillota bacterium]
MNKIANKQIICDTLIKRGKENRDILVLTSDSRGSASMAKFGEQLPEQLIEVGIAEQNIVGIAAGLASSGKLPFIASYAAFLSMRSIEQIKVDLAYSNTNVKVVGISGGLSYGPLGMSHHALQDIAVMMAIPNMTVILPADRYETEKMTDELLKYCGPVYIRVGRNSVPDIHQSANFDYEIGKALTLTEGDDLTIIATGETVKSAVDSSKLLKEKGIKARVLNMHTLKPLDEKAVIKAAQETACILTVEEHSIYGGLGAVIAQTVIQNCPVPMKMIAIPDEPAIAGHQLELFEYYGISADNIAREAVNLLNDVKQS